MDLQDNIVLTTTRFDSKKDFYIAIADNLIRNVLFSISEYDDAELTNNSQNFDIYIENIEEGGEIKISYGEKVLLNSGDHPYPAMDYRLRISNRVTGKSNLFLYKIIHSAATNDSQYKTMISTIGQYDENFLYEQDAKFLSNKRIYSSGYRNLHTLIALLINKSGLINNSLNSIYINPILKDKKEVVKTPTLGRQSARSIIKNIRSIKADITYSSQIIQYADFPLNEYLVYMLKFSKIRLEELEKNSHIELTKTKEKLFRISENANSDPSKRKKHTIYQIELYQKRINQLKLFLSCSKTFSSNIDRILRSSVFRGLEPSSKRDNTIMYHFFYLNIERQLYLPLFQGFAFSFANSYSSILSVPIKQTSKLFEAYCLLTLDAAITELGFKDVIDDIDYDHVVKRFVKDEYEFELMYEINAKDISLVKEGEVYYLNANSRHISPDFYLILKHNGSPTCFMIFDAKCRKATMVNKNIIEGKYENTIREYLSLRYSVNENPFFIPKIVDSLWLLLPNDFDGSEYAPINKLEYKFAKLELDGDESDFISVFSEYMSMYLD